MKQPISVISSEKKGVKIGGVVHTEPTLEDIRTHAVITCDANNWGMRESNMLPRNGKDQWEYPVAKAYVQGIKPALEKLPWSQMTWPFNEEQQKQIELAIEPHLRQAWAATEFGLPQAAFAEIVFPDQTNGSPATDSGQHGSFNSDKWEIKLEKLAFEILLDKNQTADARAQAIGELALTLFHEGRHTQQFFWIYTSVFAYPEDYEDYALIHALFTDLVKKKVLDVMKTKKIPDEPFAKISIKRLALSAYYRNLCFFIDRNYRTDLIGNENDPNSEVYKVRSELERFYQNVPIKKIGHDRDGGYRIRPTEEDSFALEKIVEHYWHGRDSGIPNPSKCTNLYQGVVRASNP
ncbi:hypothetical protein [Collimonas silvisoli]|uniref:hypothetical protein n=1 Tax=Collimonas silvisoli TaxID=2825884 RepID=UPI001B8ABAAA|nr:hypothetical protein [Collimonas silvisoli]